MMELLNISIAGRRIDSYLEEREMIIIRAALLTQCTNLKALLDLVNDMMHGEPV